MGSYIENRIKVLKYAIKISTTWGNKIALEQGLERVIEKQTAKKLW